MEILLGLICGLLFCILLFKRTSPTDMEIEGLKEELSHIRIQLSNISEALRDIHK